MVFYHTSTNVKVMRSIILHYDTDPESSPYEYMKTYVENCPEKIDEFKLTWIAEVFIGIQKHRLFLKEIARHISNDLTDDEFEYLVIFFHALTFYIQPKDMQNVYKSLFNLSKNLLSTLTNFLSNNENLTFISQVAQAYYDANFVTEKIISPLFLWQPYISEMAHNYVEYVMKMENRKIKPLTVPTTPAVLSRKGKETYRNTSLPSLPTAPPNSLHARRRQMVTKSAIDKKLEIIHEKNKKRAAKLLTAANCNQYVPKYQKTENNTCIDEPEKEFCFKSRKFKNTITGPPVRENVATIKKMNKRMQMTEQEEIDWFYDLTTCYRSSLRRLEDLENNERQERERERLYDIEKKHLMGQLSYEEAVLAKLKVQEVNKKKHKAFQKEKEAWYKEIEDWKKSQLEEIHKRVEELAIQELSVKEAKNNVLVKKKENAAQIKQEREILTEKIYQTKMEELNRRINMIKEIKVLSAIAKKSRVPKIVDLTETSGLGLLCEMSMAELQERLAAMKMGIEEDIQKKRFAIIQEKDCAKKELENTKTVLKSYMDDRETIRQRNKKKIEVTLDPAASKELNDLKKSLEAKRNLRSKTKI